MRTIFMVLSIGLCTSVCFAFDASQAGHYQNGHDWGQKMRERIPKASSLSPQDMPGFKGTSIQAISSSRLDKPQQEAMELVEHNPQQRPHMVIDTQQDATLKTSNELIKKAKAIVTGDARVETPSTCQTAYNYRTCEEDLPIQLRTCTKDLMVTTEEKPLVDEDIAITLHGEGREVMQGTFNMVTGEMKNFMNIRNPAIAIEPKIDSIFIDNTFSAQFIKASATMKGHFGEIPLKIVVNELPQEANHYQVSFNLHPFFRHELEAIEMEIPMDIRFMFHVRYQPRPVLHERWENHCVQLEKQTSEQRCRLIEKEICSQGPATRTLSGFSVARPCWQKKVQYHCGEEESSGFSKKNACALLRTQGCEQIDSQCEERSAQGDCRRYLQTFRCAHQPCARGIIKTLDHQKMFGIEGEGSPEKEIPSADFNRVVSALSGVAYASQDFKGEHIFTGYPKACRKDVVDFSNCCAESGWGHDLNLASCRQEEKELGLLKEKGLCHEVGSYCSHRVLGICLMHSRHYCCFNSKMARILQEQGRRPLGISWGSGEHPNCRGLTSQELQQLDFSKMDFSEFYADIQAKGKGLNPSETQKHLEQQIHAFYERGQAS